LTRFAAKYPDANISIIAESPAVLYDHLNRRELDAVIASAPPPPGTDFVPLCTYSMALLVPEGTDLASMGEVDLEALRGQKLLVQGLDHHPALMERRREYLAKFGIILETIPERGYEALIRSAQAMRHPMATLDLPPTFHDTPAGLIRKVIKPPKFEVLFGVSRLKGDVSIATEKLFNTVENLQF
jgi:DNA-binding transcriptional LysR family regulator